jgi:hypothetical protein
VSDLPKSSKRRDVIARFRELGWEGPQKPLNGRGSSRAPHPNLMVKGTRVVHLPNKHSGSGIGEGLLKQLLVQAGISHSEWLGEDAS